MCCLHPHRSFPSPRLGLSLFHGLMQRAPWMQTTCDLLQIMSHLLNLWLLSISKKDTEMATHPPSTSVVTLGTTVIVSPGSGGLRTPQAFSRLNGSQCAASWSFPNSEMVFYRPNELLFHSIQKIYLKWESGFPSFFSWGRIAFQLLCYIVSVFLWQC